MVHEHQVGRNKVKAITQHRNAIPQHKTRSANDAAPVVPDLRFEINDPLQLPPPTFNVLYVQTPRIGLLQSPLYRAFAETCQEAADMVKPLFRLGIRETSLFDKCPYYDPNFSHGPSGSLIMLRRTRELCNAIRDGSVFHHCDKPVPKGRVYIDGFPNAFTVVLLNLGAYYLITRQSNRLRGV